MEPILEGSEDEYYSLNCQGVCRTGNDVLCSAINEVPLDILDKI